MSGKLYLMSDVHGYFLPFLRILREIRFMDADRMVILGDLVAKGPDSLGVLRFVMENKNILALRGNHEQRLLQYFGADCAAGIPDSTMRSWAAGDGAGIIRQMDMLSEDGRRRTLEFVRAMPLLGAMKIGNTEYVMVHGAPDAGENGEIQGQERSLCQPDNIGEGSGKWKEWFSEKENGSNGIRIMVEQKKVFGTYEKGDYDVLINRYGSPDADNRIPKGMVSVVGHTPTFKYGKQYAGDMIIKEDKIFLDCGAGQGYDLGCLEILSGNDKNSYQKHFTNTKNGSIL